MTRHPAIKLLRRPLTSVTLILGLPLLVMWLVGCRPTPSSFKHTAEAILLAAKTPEDFRKAAYESGLYLQSTNGPWVAIVSDAPAPKMAFCEPIPITHYMIALNSGGEWFEAEHPYRLGAEGGFRDFNIFLITRNQVARDAKTHKEYADMLPSLQARLETHTNLCRMMVATNLDELDANLIAIGFKRYK